MKIQQNKKVKKIKRNQVLCREGEQVDYVYIVLSGQLSINKTVFKQKMSQSKYELQLLN